MIGYFYLLRRGRPDETAWEQIDCLSEDNGELALMKAPSDIPEGLKFLLEWRVEGVIIQRARLALSYAGMPHPSVDFTPEIGLAQVRWWFKGIGKEWRLGNPHTLNAAITIGDMYNDPIHSNAASVYQVEQFELLYNAQSEFSIKIEGLEFSEPKKLDNPFDNLLNMLKDDDDGETLHDD